MWKLELHCLDYQIGMDAEDSHWFLFLISLSVKDGDNLTAPTGCLATDSCKEMVLTC